MARRRVAAKSDLPCDVSPLLGGDFFLLGLLPRTLRE